MAAIRKHGNRWRAEVCVNGIRKSRVCDTKGRARAWAEDQERRLSGWLDPDADSKTLGDAFERYAREVSPTKKGARWEKVRLNRLRASTIADILLPALTPSHLAAWRDRRLTEVSAGSVRREMALMAGVMSYCCREWGWLDRSPLALVRKPPSPRHRDRLISVDEQHALVSALPPKVSAIFRLALETAMRLGEICSIRPGMVRGKYLALGETKSGASRLVPLSTEAQAILRSMGNEVRCSSAYVSRSFGQSCKKLGLIDLRFHDTRHTAFTRLSQKLNVLELARMAGMKDTRTLMVYFNERPEDIADKLG